MYYIWFLTAAGVLAVGLALKKLFFPSEKRMLSPFQQSRPVPNFVVGEVGCADVFHHQHRASKERGIGQRDDHEVGLAVLVHRHMPFFRIELSNPWHQPLVWP